MLEVSKSKIKSILPEKIIRNCALVTQVFANKCSFPESIMQKETNRFPFQHAHSHEHDVLRAKTPSTQA